MINTPVMVVNFKTYARGYGKQAFILAKILDDIARESGVSIAIAVSPTDIASISSEVSIPVFAQHIDPIGFGSNTGYILPEAVKEAGAKGTLINHSEHRLKLADIEHTIKRAKEIGLETIVCTNNVQTTVSAAVLNPDFVAVEPPELIGGDISVSAAKPEVISESVEVVKKLALKARVLCGAGVKTEEDVRRALELGAEGVLLASGIVNAKNVSIATKKLITGF